MIKLADAFGERRRRDRQGGVIGFERAGRLGRRAGRHGPAIAADHDGRRGRLGRSLDQRPVGRERDRGAVLVGQRDQPSGPRVRAHGRPTPSARPRNTTAQVSELSKAAGRIGDVVELINTIAGPDQPARAQRHHRGGTCGRSRPRLCRRRLEVKALAEQTAKATGEIGQQISAIQSATEQSVGAITTISDDDPVAVGDRLDHRRRRRGTGCRDPGNRAQRPAGRARHPGRCPRASPTYSAARPRPDRPPRSCSPRRSRCHRTRAACSRKSDASWRACALRRPGLHQTPVTAGTVGTAAALSAA